MELAKTTYLLMILIICAWTDYKEKKIKNGCALAVMAGGAVFHILFWESKAVVAALWMMILFFAVLFPLYCIHALGAGDVKLLSAMAFYIGNAGQDMFLIGLLTSAGMLSFIKLLYYKTFFKRMKYLVLYMKHVVTTGEIISYGMPSKDEDTLRLAFPALVGVIIWGIGGR